MACSNLCFIYLFTTKEVFYTILNGVYKTNVVNCQFIVFSKHRCYTIVSKMFQSHLYRIGLNEVIRKFHLFNDWLNNFCISKETCTVFSHRRH